MDARTTEEGQTVYVAEDEPRVGSKGPFYVAYRSEDREDRFGYQCSNCGTFDNAMDSMGRLVCNECGNTRKPDDWDAVGEA